MERRDGLSGAGEGESAGAGGFAHAAIDRKTERAEAGVVAQFSGEYLIERDRVLELTSFKLGGGEKDVSSVVAAYFSPVRVGESP